MPDKARDPKGQGLVEYALILVLVAVVVIVILALLGPAIGNIFTNIIDSLNPTATLAAAPTVTAAPTTAIEPTLTPTPGV